MSYEHKTVSTKIEPAVTQARVFAVKTTSISATKADSKWNPETRHSEPIPEDERLWEEEDPDVWVLYATYTPSEFGGHAGSVKFGSPVELYDQDDIDTIRAMLDQIEASGVLKSD